MIGLEVKEARIFVRPGATDMRKQINGLAVIIEQQMDSNVFEAALFLFCNGERRILKALYWDRTGFCLWQKRLEKHRFPWPRTPEQARTEIDAQKLHMLLDGHRLLVGASGAELHEGELKTQGKSSESALFGRCGVAIRCAPWRGTSRR